MLGSSGSDSVKHTYMYTYIYKYTQSLGLSLGQFSVLAGAAKYTRIRQNFETKKKRSKFKERGSEGEGGLEALD